MNVYARKSGLAQQESELIAAIEAHCGHDGFQAFRFLFVFPVVFVDDDNVSAFFKRTACFFEGLKRVVPKVKRLHR